MSGPPRPARALALIFALSGAAGLVHEVVWARALGQSLGNSLNALTGVLVAFLGGLGVGAAWGTRLAGRAGSPLRTYAALEFGIALYGLLGPLVAIAIERLVMIAGPWFGLGAPLAALRLGLAVASLAPLTVAMGATFPCVVRHLAAGGAPPGGAISLLYGSNTLGAAVGSLLGSFLLLPLAGTRLTFVAAAALNALAGAAALSLARRRPAVIATGEPTLVADGPAETAPARTFHGLAAGAAAAVSGAVGALLQFGWMRAATLSFGSSIYALGLTLAAYILGIGAGPFAVRRALERPGSAPAVAGGAQAIAGLAALLTLPLFGLLPVAAAALSGGWAENPLPLLVGQFAIVALLILVPTLAQGATFPALAALAAGGAREAHRAAGIVYAASTWGTVLGFLAAGFVALPALGTHRTLCAAALAAVLTGAALLLARPRAGAGGVFAPRRLAAPVLLVATALALAAVLPGWDPSLITGGGFLYGPIYRAAAGPGREVPEAMRRRGSILYYREAGDSLVTVRRSPTGILSLQINGKTEASTGGDLPTQLLAAHLPLLLHPRPDEALIVGLASGITLGAAERHGTRRIGVVEIAPAVVEAARLFDAHHGRALDDPRVELSIDDARGLLLARPRRYDVIVSQPSNPWVAGVANLFTVEFYRLARRRLQPGGLLCQWVQAYRLSPEDLRGIVASFLSVFPEATLWEESAGGGDYFLIGGPDPVALDPAVLGRPGTDAAWLDLRRGGVAGPAALLARFVAGPDALAAFAGGARLHTDDRPYLEWRAPLALFRDTLRDQIAALRRCREPVVPYLPSTPAGRDPSLLRDLAAEARRRDDRLALLESLRQADLEGLADPFLAAGAEYLRLGRPAEAIGALVRAASREGSGAVVHLLLGEAYRSAGLADAATVAYREALARDPDFAPAWNALGRQFAALGLLAQARVVFEEALRADPALAAARNNLGTLLLEEGDPEAAEACFRLALSADPHLAAARVNLGLALKRQGDREGAAAEYRAALDLDPLHPDARFNLAVVLRESGRAAEARRELERLLAIDPTDADALRALD